MKVLQEFISSSRNGKIFLQLSMKTETKNLPFLLIFEYPDKATKALIELTFFIRTSGDMGTLNHMVIVACVARVALSCSDDVVTI